MSVRTTMLSMIALGVLSACSVEDENPTERCGPELTCSGELVCYRGFCVESGEAVAAAKDAGELGTPSLESSMPDAAAVAVAPPDASVTTRSPAPSTAAPSTEPATPSAADAGRAPLAEPPSRPSEVVADTTPAKPAMPSEPTDAAVATPQPAQPVVQPELWPSDPETASTWLSDLVEVGLLPVYVLNCVPKCLTLEPSKECEQCVDKAMKNEGKKVECNDNRGRGNRANCVVRECGDDECEE